MASTYNIEPHPTAKVLLTTSAGDILLELFAKQTPRASRSFMQHCLDGYYDDTLFHRLVPGFIIQGGDPTGTGEGGEAIYPERVFEDEFHSRLKWNRRGLLGMANEGRSGTNGSQFFLSLGPDCAQLEKKNTLFGRVASGDTIYNVMKMGEGEVTDGTDRPMYPHKILGAEILVNPFEDMVRREIHKVATVSAEVNGTSKVKRAKKKATKQLLSFGADADDADGDAEPIVSQKAKYNPMLIDELPAASDSKKIKAKATIVTPGQDDTINESIQRNKTNIVVSKSAPRLPISPKPRPTTQLPSKNPEVPSRSSSVSSQASDERPEMNRVQSLLDKTNQQIADMKASMKRHGTTENDQRKHEKKDEKNQQNNLLLEQMMPANATKGKKRKLEQSVSASQTLESLHAFQAQLDRASTKTGNRTKETKMLEQGISKPPKSSKQMTKPESAAKNDVEPDEDEAILCDLHFIANCQSCQAWDNEMAVSDEADGKSKSTKRHGRHAKDQRDHDTDDDSDWMAHSLSFEKDRLGKDLTWKQKNEEELVVIDPREKALNLKEEQRARQQTRKGSSKAFRIDQTSTRDRDRDRSRMKA